MENHDKLENKVYNLLYLKVLRIELHTKQSKSLKAKIQILSLTVALTSEIIITVLMIILPGTIARKKKKKKNSP